MLSATKSRRSDVKAGFAGKKLEYWKYCLTIISLALVSVQINAQNGWTMKSQIPTPRGGLCACVVDNKIYVIGGITGSPGFSDLAVNEMYDPLTDTWDTLAPMPTPRGYLSCAVVNDTIYAIGGGYPTATKRVDAYDPVTDTWSPKKDMLSVRRSAQAGVVNGIIYNIGGNKGVDQPSPNCEAYDPVKNTWTAKTDLPAGGGNLAATVYNDSIYTFGGSTYSPWSGFSHVYAYNPQTDTWSSPKQSMPTARFGLQTYLVNGKIYAIGGAQNGYSALATVEVYDPVTDTWEPKENMPFNSVFFAGAVVNNKIYVIGGSPDWLTGALNVWEYDPAYIVPVELTSFTASANGEEVILNWSTATELNNLGFEIQRSITGSEFFTVGFVEGYGTTSEQHNYKYSDRNLNNGKYYYRLKQVDFNGSYEYSDAVEVEWRAFNSYLLEQNYPNPFNPTTTIGFGVQNKSNVKITLLNSIGEEVAVILNEEREPGFYQVEFNASYLPSGVYFYRMHSGNFVQTKKMLLLK